MYVHMYAFSDCLRVRNCVSSTHSVNFRMFLRAFSGKHKRYSPRRCYRPNPMGGENRLGGMYFHSRYRFHFPLFGFPFLASQKALQKIQRECAVLYTGRCSRKGGGRIEIIAEEGGGQIHKVSKSCAPCILLFWCTSLHSRRNAKCIHSSSERSVSWSSNMQLHRL